ncbi:MAG: UPF0146 family protein [Candidatus Jordarchaeum sp.]|uniref:UPF0146 family protein n=1 Tax=Candidatus Jordarchaeum sp. TaxID=2823881 RepID=UPI00404B758A
MKLVDAENIIEYIISNYRYSGKIVEVGVGKFPQIALGLKKALPETEIIVTDLNPQFLEYLSNENIKTFVDDIIKPDIKIYSNSDLIYSIRPPPEFQHYLFRIAKIVKADLILRLLTNEYLCIYHPSHEIINYKKTVLHLFKHKKQSY